MSAFVNSVENAPWTHQLVLILLVSFSSLLSLLGSVSIIIIIAKNKHWRKGLYYRLLAGISVGDMVASIGFLIGPYIEPNDEGSLLAAYGNTQACTFGGALVNTIFLAIFYNACLAIFYFCTIVLGMKEEKLSKQYEKWMHFCSIGLVVLFQITATILEAYNPSQVTRICGYSRYPNGCETKVNPDEECIRGRYGNQLDYVFFGLIAVPSFLGIGLTLWVYIHVRSTLAANIKYSIGHEDSRKQENKCKKDVARQAVLYCLALINTAFWAPVIIVFDFQQAKNEVFFTFCVFQSFFMPLQGLLNFAVFVRPRYLKIRRKFPEKGRLFAFFELYSCKPRLVSSSFKPDANKTATGAQQEEVSGTNHAETQQELNSSFNSPNHPRQSSTDSETTLEQGEDIV